MNDPAIQYLNDAALRDRIRQLEREKKELVELGKALGEELRITNSNYLKVLDELDKTKFLNISNEKVALDALNKIAAFRRWLFTGKKTPFGARTEWNEIFGENLSLKGCYDE